MKERTIRIEEIPVQENCIVAGSRNHNRPRWISVRLLKYSLKFDVGGHINMGFGRRYASGNAKIKKIVRFDNEEQAERQYAHIVSQFRKGNYRISQKGHGWGLELLFYQDTASLMPDPAH